MLNRWKIVFLKEVNAAIDKHKDKPDLSVRELGEELHMRHDQLYRKLKNAYWAFCKSLYTYLSVKLCGGYVKEQKIYGDGSSL